MSEEWVVVYSSSQEYKPALLRILLEEELGMVSMLVDKRDSAYRFGDVELYVRPQDAVLAMHFISKHFDNE